MFHKKRSITEWVKHLEINKKETEHVILFTGNPKTGKTALFHALSHTKHKLYVRQKNALPCSFASISYQRQDFLLTDLSGIISCPTDFFEEKIKSLLEQKKINTIIVVCSVLSLENDIKFALKILEVTNRVIVCVNKIDLANKKRLILDLHTLEKFLNVPVISTCAKWGKGLELLLEIAAAKNK